MHCKIPLIPSISYSINSTHQLNIPGSSVLFHWHPPCSTTWGMGEYGGVMWRSDLTTLLLRLSPMTIPLTTGLWWLSESCRLLSGGAWVANSQFQILENCEFTQLCPEILTKSTIVLQTFISKFKVLYKLPVIIHPLIHVSSLIANEMGECAFYCRISRNIRNTSYLRYTSEAMWFAEKGADKMCYNSTYFICIIRGYTRRIYKYDFDLTPVAWTSIFRTRQQSSVMSSRHM